MPTNSEWRVFRLVDCPVEYHPDAYDIRSMYPVRLEDTGFRYMTHREAVADIGASRPGEQFVVLEVFNAS